MGCFQNVVHPLHTLSWEHSLYEGRSQKRFPDDVHVPSLPGPQNDSQLILITPLFLYHLSRLPWLCPLQLACIHSLPFWYLPDETPCTAMGHKSPENIHMYRFFQLLVLRSPQLPSAPVPHLYDEYSPVPRVL